MTNSQSLLFKSFSRRARRERIDLEVHRKSLSDEAFGIVFIDKRAARERDRREKEKGAGDTKCSSFLCCALLLFTMNIHERVWTTFINYSSMNNNSDDLMARLAVMMIHADEYSSARGS